MFLPRFRHFFHIRRNFVHGCCFVTHKLEDERVERQAGTEEMQRRLTR